MVAKIIALSPAQSLRLVLVAALGLGAVSAANAKDVEYTMTQKIACTPDAVRLCSDAIPNASRVRACMIAKKSKLSSICRSVFGS